MTNQEIAAAFREIYNRFWLKWRDRENTEQDFDKISAEASELLKKYPFKLAQDMVLNFLDELDQRHWKRNNRR